MGRAARPKAQKEPGSGEGERPDTWEPFRTLTMQMTSLGGCGAPAPGGGDEEGVDAAGARALPVRSQPSITGLALVAAQTSPDPGQTPG